jgi:hypothetical protein
MALVTSLHWLRMMSELFHFILWMLLIYAIVCGPRQLLWLALLCIIGVSLVWKLHGSCPLSDLEFCLNPRGIREHRSRIGTFLMEKLELSMRAWDAFMSSLGLGLFLLCVYRLACERK